MQKSIFALLLYSIPIVYLSFVIILYLLFYLQHLLQLRRTHVTHHRVGQIPSVALLHPQEEQKQHPAPANKHLSEHHQTVGRNASLTQNVLERKHVLSKNVKIHVSSSVESMLSAELSIITQCVSAQMVTPEIPSPDVCRNHQVSTIIFRLQDHPFNSFSLMLKPE